MNPILKFTRCAWIPLNFRRLVAGWFVPKSSERFEVEIGGVAYAGRMDNYVEWLAYVTGAFFEFSYINLIRRLVSGGTAIDVGANVGNHSLAFSTFFDRVHSVEPFPVVADRLDEKAARTAGITTHRLALSDHAGEARFAPPETDNLGTGRIAEGGTLTVPLMRGDDFVAAHVAGRVNFIKIDVEGHEVPVLKGLKETIARDRPVVMFEVAPALRASHGHGLSHYLGLFPDDYRFVCTKGQSTFPTQRNVAAVWAISRESAKPPGRITYVIAYGPERGLVLDGVELKRG